MQGGALATARRAKVDLPQSRDLAQPQPFVFHLFLIFVGDKRRVANYTEGFNRPLRGGFKLFLTTFSTAATRARPSLGVFSCFLFS